MSKTVTQTCALQRWRNQILRNSDPDSADGSSEYPDWSRTGTTPKCNSRFVPLPVSVISPSLVKIWPTNARK